MSDMFGSTIDDTVSRGTKFEQRKYLSLKPGEYRIRILDPMETRMDAHYVIASGTYLKCLGDECPICQNNKRIMYEHPEDYREVAGWTPRRPRFFLNVLDRADGEVKILACGPKLIEDLKRMSKAIRNEQDERIDIRHYDWTLIVEGVGRDKETTPSHNFYGKETEPEIGDRKLYDLTKCLVELAPDEMLDAFNGVSLKDIFAARKAKKQSDEINEIVDEIQSNIEQEVSNLFQED